MAVNGTADDLNLPGKAWLALGIGPQRPPPALHVLEKRVADSRLALVTTGALYRPGQDLSTPVSLATPVSAR